MDSGIAAGNHSFPYEYVIKKKETVVLRLIRALLCVAYALWTLGNAAVVLLFKELLVLMVLVWISGLWLMIFLTWRRTKVEYEFSFFGGELTVCRILGSKTRKQLASLSLRELSAVFTYDDEHLPLIDRFMPQKKILAVSSLDAEELYVLLWKGENDVKYMLCMETTEKALRSIRQYNAFAFRR